jgi:hypothetical protein
MSITVKGTVNDRKSGKESRDMLRQRFEAKTDIEIEPGPSESLDSQFPGTSTEPTRKPREVALCFSPDKSGCERALHWKQHAEWIEKLSVRKINNELVRENEMLRTKMQQAMNTLEKGIMGQPIKPSKKEEGGKASKKYELRIKKSKD